MTSHGVPVQYKQERSEVQYYGLGISHDNGSRSGVVESVAGVEWSGSSGRKGGSRRGSGRGSLYNHPPSRQALT